LLIVKYSGDFVQLSFYCPSTRFEELDSDQFDAIVEEFRLCEKSEDTGDAVTDKKTPDSMKIASSDNVEYVMYVPSSWICNSESGMSEAYFDESAASYINNSGSQASTNDEDAGDGMVEDVYIEALKLVILSNTASISMLQRKCSVGYPKAGKIIEWMEDMGYISPYDGARARKVLITKEEFEELYGEF
jgi:DNA segregation ATPase FtsK/SpoIIIE-like protein